MSIRGCVSTAAGAGGAGSAAVDFVLVVAPSDKMSFVDDDPA